VAFFCERSKNTSNPRSGRFTEVRQIRTVWWREEKRVCICSSTSSVEVLTKIVGLLSDLAYISEHQGKRTIGCHHICAEFVNDESNLGQKDEQIKHKEKLANTFCNFMITKVNK
jgi:hypothetical protein